MNTIIEFLNNPALLVLALEIIGFLLFVNICLLFVVTKKKNKAVKALNALIKDIKAKEEENKKKMAEMLLQPGLTDPEAIKKGLQELVAGQNQFYKDMIKAIRTQSVEDVSHLGDSMTGLINSAIALGRESGEGLVDKEAQEKLEKENASLSEENAELETKLKTTADEMSVLMNEYKSMMTNAETEEGKEEDAGSDATNDSSEETEAVDETEVVDISEDEAEQEQEQEQEQVETEDENNLVDELMNEVLGEDAATEENEKESEEQAA